MSAIIPDEMIALKRWVAWKYEQVADKDGKTRVTKVPCSLTPPHHPRDAHKPEYWNDYQRVEAARAAYPDLGIGFDFNGDGFVFIDLDNVRNPDTGEIYPGVEEEIRGFNSFTEISPSGTGFHIFCRGVNPPGTTKDGWSKKKPRGDGGIQGRELYFKRHFSTVTGNHLEWTPTELNDAQPAINALYAAWFKVEEPAAPRDQTTTKRAPAGPGRTDDEIITRVKSGRDELFTRLWDGDISKYGGDDSAADLALCDKLAFYTGKDAGQMDRLFRQSGLYRDKWDERRGSDTYGDITISKAIAGTTETYKRPVHYEPGSITDRVKRVHEVKNREGKLIKQTVAIDNQKFVECMVEKYHCVSVAGNVWIYDNGCYRPDKGEIQAELSTVIKDLGLQEQTHIHREIKSMLEGTNFYRDSPFNFARGIIPARNGVIHINFDTGEVTGPHPHSPENLFTYCLKADFDPAAPTEPVITLFKQWVADQDVGILSQFPAQGFIQSMIDATYKKSYLFQGETNSGKSSYFELIYRTIGDDDGTISHISIHAMCDRPFSLYEMENRILNIYDDLDGAELTNHGRFKNITGITKHQIERKHSAGYTGRIFCSHGFSCNTPPKIPDKIKYDPAFWDRWEYTVFPNEYKKDPKFYERTYTPELLSGFLNLIVKSIVDIYVNDNLIQNSTYEEVMEKWLQDSDPLLQFIQENTNESERLQYFSKAQLFKAYSKWFDDQGLPDRKKITTIEKFSRDIQSHGFLTTKLSVSQGDGSKRKIRVRCYAANRVWGEGQMQMTPTAEDGGQTKVTNEPGEGSP